MVGKNMLSLDRRLDLAVRLGEYMLSDTGEWIAAQQMAVNANTWFTPGDVSTAISNIAHQYLEKDKLYHWITTYQQPAQIKTVGIVMAGNIPLVGFHDLLSGFMSGHRLLIKLSSKDSVLLLHLIARLAEWEPLTKYVIGISDILKGCDAYIATGSNNTARYFEQYFGKYPNIIRKNRTSVAVLDGSESESDLHELGKDLFGYFGLGCRNVSQVCVPRGYDFTKLLGIFENFQDVIDHHKYKNNYDYYLAIYLLNKVPYLSNGSLLLVENELPFSPVAVLHYRYYEDKHRIIAELQNSNDIQCIVGNGLIPFGYAQVPSLFDYADGIDTMQFLCNL